MPIFDEDSSVTTESEDSLDTTEDTDEGQENINNSEVEKTETPAVTDGQPPEADVTNKGTKLDEDPLSRANQLRANAEGQLKQAVEYIKYLKGNPNQPKPPVKPEGQEEELFLDASKIQNTEDLQKFAASLQKVVEKKYQEIQKNFSSSIQERQIEKTQETVAKGIESIQSSYPELKEFNTDGTKNPMYNPVLDKELSDRIVELDFDESRGIYKGGVNIAKLAESMVKSYRSGKSNGTESAKTKIIDKQIGNLKNGPPSNSTEEEGSESAESFVANAIKAKR